MVSETNKSLDDTHAWKARYDSRLDALARSVDENTRMTAEAVLLTSGNGAKIEKIERNTNEIVAFFEAGKGTFKALKFIGIVAKWITSVAAAVAVAFLIWKSGGKP